MIRQYFLSGSLLVSFILSGQYSGHDSPNSYNEMRNEAGSVLLYYGGLPIDTIPDLYFYGVEENDHFGTAASPAGDFNGDGYDDIILGRWDVAHACLYLGGENMDTEPDLILHEQGSHIYFGECASTAGDMNGDGFSDVIVADCQNGFVKVYLGNNAIEKVSPFDYLTYHAKSYFRNCASSAGDFNGDGYADVIVGDYSDETYGYRGRVRIFFGSDTLDNKVDLVLTTGKEGDYFGEAVACAGDVNGDGYSDVMVGAPGFEDEEPGAEGRVYVYFGNPDGDTEPDVIITGTDEQPVGRYINSLGDLNNDGFDDIAVSIPFFGNIELPNNVYIYYGGKVMDNIEDAVISMVSINFGADVASIGDINHDKYDDMIVGCSFYPLGAYIYYGGDIMHTTVDEILPGGWWSWYEDGVSCSSAGDVNNDGFPDILIGWPSQNVDAQAADHFFMEGRTEIRIYPNPLTLSTNIFYRLERPAFIEIAIIDIQGRVQAVLVKGYQSAGDHSIEWKADNFSPGVYFCTIRSEQFNITRKMILVR
jgi:hypothetical protein